MKTSDPPNMSLQEGQSLANTALWICHSPAMMQPRVAQFMFAHFPWSTTSSKSFQLHKIAFKKLKSLTQ